MFPNFQQVDDLYLVYLHRITVRSQLIYISVLIAFLASLLSLPLIKVEVGTRSFGSIQSTLARVPLLAPANGRLTYLNLQDNLPVVKGHTLLRIDAIVPQQQEQLLVKKEKQYIRLHLDVREILAANHQLSNTPELLPTTGLNLKTELYQANWQQYCSKRLQIRQDVLQLKRIYERNLQLFDKRVITLAEFETHQFNYRQALTAQDLAVKNFTNQLQIEAQQYEQEVDALKNQMAQVATEKKSYELKATISGSAQNVIGLQIGSNVYLHQKIGEISPDTVLFAYCEVSPSAIGLIRLGQQVKFQISAFHHNQWGILTGHVVDISDDTNTTNEGVFFKVKCALDHNFLQLRNGYKGQLKKGMTLTANFMIAKRSLYQLLWEKADDWLDPNIQK